MTRPTRCNKMHGNLEHQPLMSDYRACWWVEECNWRVNISCWCYFACTCHFCI